MAAENKSSYFNSVSSGLSCLEHSWKVLTVYPVLLLPIFLCSVIDALLTLYIKYFVNWDAYTTTMTYFMVFVFLLIFTFIYSLSALILLELLEQLERERSLSFSAAVLQAIGKDLPKALPIIFIWAILDFILRILDAINRKSDEDDNEPLDMENAAKTIAGYREFSFSGLAIQAVQKAIRMISFLIFPAIAWENLPPLKAAKKAMVILKIHTTEIIAGYFSTGAAAGLVFLPPALLFFASDHFKVQVPDLVWGFAILYITVAWSFYLYLEQNFLAALYLWHRKWEPEATLAEKEGRPVPRLQDIPQPSFLDDIADLK